MKILSSLLWPYTREVTFPSDFSLDESVARLQQTLVPEVPKYSGRDRPDGCVGHVSAQQVKLAYQNAGYRNSFAPRFSGRFEDTAGHVRLIGGFTMRKVAWFFRVVVFLFCLFWVVGGAYLTLTQEVDLPEALVVLCGGGVAILLIILLLCFFQSTGKRDEQKIRQIIQQRLSAKG